MSDAEEAGPGPGSAHDARMHPMFKRQKTNAGIPIQPQQPLAAPSALEPAAHVNAEQAQKHRSDRFQCKWLDPELYPNWAPYIKKVQRL